MKLTFQAPNREWYRTETGLWASRRWTVETRAQYVDDGAHFKDGEHEMWDEPGEKFPPEGKNCGWSCQVHRK